MPNKKNIIFWQSVCNPFFFGVNIGFVYGEYYEKRRIGAGRKNNKKMRTKIVIIWTKILKESTAFSVVFSLRVIRFLICISGFNFVIWHV